MSKLLEFQKTFLNTITQDLNSELPITPVGTLNYEGVMNVYKSDYISRLTEALGERFETVWTVLGDEDYFKVAKSFIEEHPSDTKNLSNYGDAFPEYLSKTTYFTDFPFLKDLAEFEIIFWKAFHSKQESIIVDWANIHNLETKELKLTNNASIFSWDYSIYDIFRCRKDGFENTDYDFTSTQSILMFNNSNVVQIKELKKQEYEVLTQIQKGKSLSEISTSIDISSLFQFLAQEKIIFPT